MSNNSTHPKCPICGTEIDGKTKPFCSTRCKDVDLNRWLSGNYAIPIRSLPSDDVQDE